MSRTLDYALVDVFAERPLEGNMLAIFTDANGLTSDEMQALARETNLSETTFLLPRDPAIEAREGVRVRIFTVDEEFPFAGHPTLGTAAWLHLHHPRYAGAGEITLALNVGPIPVRFTPGPGPGVFGSMRQRDPVFGATCSPHLLADTLGLAPDDFDPACPAQIVSTGLPFCLVLLRSPQVLARLRIPQTLAAPWLSTHAAKYFYCLAPAGPGVFQARMQWSAGEDPATGSAAGCAAAWLVKHGLVASAQPALIEQGTHVQRPSRLTVQASLSRNGTIHDVFVAGRTVSVASGRFFLP